MKRAIEQWLVKRLGFRVYLQGGDWDGISHYAWTGGEALQWMACYPANVQKFVFNRRGAVVAYQWAYRP